MRLSPRQSWAIRGVVLLAVLTSRQVRLESARWWRSSAVAVELGMTAEQASAIDSVYEDSLSAQELAVQDVCSKAGQVDAYIRDDVYDETLLRATTDLATASTRRDHLWKQTLTRTVGVLSREQGEKLNQIIAGGRSDH